MTRPALSARDTHRRAPYARRALALAALSLLTVGACTPGAYHARVDPEPGVMRGAPVTPDSVREIPAPPEGPTWQERLTETIGGPYEVLARIDATSATKRAVEFGRRRVREETARLGGNAMVVLSATRDVTGPYTRTWGQALRLLPPMPDAEARCLAPLDRATAAAQVVACRELARQQPARSDAPAKQAVAHLALAVSATTGHEVDGALIETSFAMMRAARADPRYREAAPWLTLAQPLFGTDTARAALIVARRLDLAGLVPASIEAAREGIRVAPRNELAVELTADLLRRAGRHAESRAVAVAYATLEPDRVDGWLLAGMAASRDGRHVLAMKAFARVEAIDRDYFTRRRMEPTKGADEERASRRAVGKQAPATLAELVDEPA